MRRTEDTRDKAIAWSLLGLMALVFVVLQTATIPRLSNAHFGDVEFTGWSGPVGQYLRRGLRPYIDFVLPIPPGSFALLALVQHLQEKMIVLQELVLNEVCHLGMGIAAYFLARPFASRKSAVWTAIASLIIVWEINKECAYDQTAELVAWISLAVLSHATLSDDERRTRRSYWAAGLFAGLTFVFKQSTGLGASLGGFAALAYLGLVNRHETRTFVRRAASYAAGLGIGLLVLWFLLLALGSTGRAFVQATLLDASDLKGGARTLLLNLFLYLFVHGSFPATLGSLTVAVLAGFAAARQKGGLHLGATGSRPASFETWEVALVSTLLLGFPLAGAAVLWRGPLGYPLSWVLPLDALRHFALLGLVLIAVFFAAHLSSDESTPPDERRRGHAFNAIVIAGLGSSLMHNTSAPEFRPFYDNNAVIAVATTALFVFLERARLGWVAILSLAVAFCGASGNKYYRAMMAKLPVTAGYWGGSLINAHHFVVYQAALRAQLLAGPRGTALVLPEDTQIAALIDRDRPPLRGAIVFVDQYASRLVDDDIQRLDAHLPDVIVIHPRDRLDWERFFRIWSGTSGAERLINHVERDLLPNEYDLDSSYGTTFLWQPAILDVYRRRQRSAPALPEAH